METYTVLSAEEYYITPTDLGWRLVLRRESDQAQGLYIFPQSAFEWRAAEYGLDPNDVDTLLDIILHEPYTPSPLTVETDPAYLEGGLCCTRTHNQGLHRAGDLVPLTLLTAQTTEEARTAMLLRIADAKATRAQVQSAPSTETVEGFRGMALTTGPLDKVRNSISLSAAEVEEKTRLVELRRQSQLDSLSTSEAEELSGLTSKVKLSPTLNPKDGRKVNG